MAPTSTSDNGTIFDVVIKASDSCEYISAKLDLVDQLNVSINEEHLTSLLDHTSEVELSLKSCALRGEKLTKLLDCCPDLEPILNLNIKLDKCIDDRVRFDEAIDLLETIDHLYKEYGHEIQIIERIFKQSKKQSEYLISILCDILEDRNDKKTDVKTIVRHLARCGNFSDRELRLKYLQARDNWFNHRCEEQNNSFDNVVSVHCSGLKMIFNEYKSIFGDSFESLDRNTMKFNDVESTKEDGAIINSWLLLRTSVFIASLEVYLKTISQSGTQTPSMIADTMQKCFELTGYLSSMGFDFSPQLRPLFAQALIEEVKSSIEEATSKFETIFTATASKSIESLLLPVDDEILRISNMRPEEQLPKTTEHYPIFRIYCLYLIDSLRWLRTTKDILSPISLCLETYAALNGSLVRVMKALAIILNMDNNINHPILSKIAVSFTTEVVPFFINYCELLFPEKVILSVLGLSKSEFKVISTSEPDKLKNFRIDLKQIIDPLRGTMPALLQSIES